MRPPAGFGLVVCATLALGFRCTAPPPLEPFEVEATLPLPPEVLTPSTSGTGDSRAFGGKLTPDERHAVVAVVVDGRNQAGILGLEDGSFACVTCGAFERAAGLEPFPDGTRALVNLGGGGIGDIQFAVLECAPSLYDCRSRSTLPVRFPIRGIVQGAQNRGAQIHPDGVHLKWSEVRVEEGEIMTVGRLERTATQYTVVPLAVLNPAYAVGDDPDDWIAGGRYYELGEWIDGGAGIKYGTTTTAANYDVWELDLATGLRRQVTRDLDYNELYDGSPDGAWIAYSSARGLDRMDVFSQLVRPAFLEMVAFPAIGRVGLWNNRRCMNERWLMDRAGQRDGYAGQPIVIEENWVIRGWSWFADGTRALAAEERLPNEPLPSVGYERARLRVLRFPARAPTAPQPVVPLAGVDLSWAVPYGAYQGMASQQVAGHAVPGRAAGTATLDFAGSFITGTWSVAYDGYSDDGASFVSGTESVTATNALTDVTWSADLSVRGASNGHLRGTLAVSGPGSFSGAIESEVDGLRFDRVPTQADCPGVRPPPLAIAAVERTARAEGGWRLLVRVTAQVPEDPSPRAVRRARVESGGAEALTDYYGWAILEGEGDTPAEVKASAGGFLAASATLD
jgi:hypothetical protein